MSFFKKSVLAASKAPIPRLPQCGACGLLHLCQSPKMPVNGKGKRGILIVGEAPGKTEDERNRQFVGITGQLLEGTLAKLGINMRRDCWLTNSLICRPPKNATPTSAQIGYCRPNLIKIIEELKPSVIIPLGGAAVESLTGWLWKDDVKGIGRWVGWQIPCQKLNAWICPTYHPSFIHRSLEKNRSKSCVENVLWTQHLQGILPLIETRPWKKLPSFEKEVEVIVNVREAAQVIRAFIEYGGKAAFDFESTSIKPEWPASRIVTCSICWEGKRTIAYPWHGEAIDATKDFLVSGIKKIASNQKFEDRWCRTQLGISVRNWWHDTMNNAHVLDNRRDITSIKFQAFVLLGQESYDDHIKGSLKAKKDQKINKILKDVELNQLLLYNGLDSLLEYKVMKIQRERMGF